MRNNTKKRIELNNDTTNTSFSQCEFEAPWKKPLFIFIIERCMYVCMYVYVYVLSHYVVGFKQLCINKTPKSNHFIILDQL